MYLNLVNCEMGNVIMYSWNIDLKMELTRANGKKE